jgi:hypothetical protein
MLLNDSHLKPRAVRPQHHRGDDDLEYQKHRFKRNTKLPLPGAPNIEMVL